MKFNIKDYDIGIIIVMLSLFLWGYYNVFSFKSLPSPMYGGDYYYQLGQIFHMYESPIMDWFSTSNGLGKRPAYFPIYGALTTILGIILMQNQAGAMFYASIIYLPISVLVMFALIKYIFKEGYVALATSILYASLLNPWIFKYTEFMGYIVFPLFLLSLFYFKEKRDLKSSIVLGIMYGISLLSHSTALITTTSFLFSFLLLYIIEHKGKLKNVFERVKKEKNLLTNLIVAFSIGFAIGLIYWFEPLFILRGEGGLKSYIWSLEDYRNLSFSIPYGIGLLQKYFLDLSDPLSSLRGILTLIGVYFAYKRKEYFLLSLLIISFAITYSYIITSPLFDIHFLPSYQFSLYLNKIFILFIPFAFKEMKWFKEEKKKKLIIILLFAFLLISITTKQSIIDETPIVKYARENTLPAEKMELSSFILKRTNVNDVILSNNELSFVVNALSGRKLVVSRRAHNDGFMQDYDRRQMDAAIIFYGNDNEKRKELLKKYGVKYVYYAREWRAVEYGKITENNIEVKDPLMVVYSKEKEEELKKYGVKYLRDYFYLDASVRNENVRLYDVLMISYENYYFSGYGPWRDDMDKYLKLVWAARNEDGIIIEALYEVVLE